MAQIKVLFALNSQGSGKAQIRAGTYPTTIRLDCDSVRTECPKLSWKKAGVLRLFTSAVGARKARYSVRKLESIATINGSFRKTSTYSPLVVSFLSIKMDSITNIVGLESHVAGIRPGSECFEWYNHAINGSLFTLHLHASSVAKTTDLRLGSYD
ncbi:MAG: hypothetical protein Q9175_001799 [Cornicularia normoerica]